MSCLSNIKVYIGAMNADTVSKDTLKRKLKDLKGTFNFTIVGADVVVYSHGSPTTLATAKANNIPVVTSQWLDVCHKTGEYHDPRDFLHPDAAAEATSSPGVQGSNNSKAKYVCPAAQVVRTTTTGTAPDPAPESPKRKKDRKKEAKEITAEKSGPKKQHNPHVCVSGDEKETLETIVQNLGGTVVADPFKAKATVFVVDGEKRTVKVLYALAHNIPVVLHTWLLQSLCSNEFVAHKPFLSKLSHVNAEGRAAAGTHALLEGKTITFVGDFRAPTKAELCDLATALGASVTEVADGDTDIVIVPKEMTVLRGMPRGISAKVVRQLWLHDTVAAHSVKNFDTYGVAAPEHDGEASDASSSSGSEEAQLSGEDNDDGSLSSANTKDSSQSVSSASSSAKTKSKKSKTKRERGDASEGDKKAKKLKSSKTSPKKKSRKLSRSCSPVKKRATSPSKPKKLKVK